MASSSVDLFKRFGIPDCPISHGPVTNPLFADCNEAKIRTDLMDQICKKIFEVKQETGNYPDWYSENGIRFSEAMEALKIDPNIRERIGPDAPRYRRLLTSEGTFNEDGLHLFEKEILINWLYRGPSAFCPKCIQPCSTVISKAYYCFVKYQDPDRYLTDKSVETTFQTEEQRRQGVNRFVSASGTINRVFRTIESGTHNYWVPFTIFTINIWYFLIAYDTIFSTTLTPKYVEVHDKTIYIQSKITTGLRYLNWAQMLWSFFRTGRLVENNGLAVYSSLVSSHFSLIPKNVDPLLLRIVAVYYSVQKIGKMVLPTQALNHRYMQRLGTIPRAILDPVSNFALRIDSFVQRQIGRWLIPFLLYSFRFALYTLVLAFAASLLKRDLVQGYAYLLHSLAVDLINWVQKMIRPFFTEWEAGRNICLILNSGEIRPMAGNNYFTYLNIFNSVVSISYNQYIYRGFACYAVIRDILWLLKIPNPVRYVPYLRYLEGSRLLNL